MGRTSAMTLSVGHECAHVCAIYEGLVYDETKVVEECGGRDVTQELVAALGPRMQHHFRESDLIDICQELKERYCYAYCDAMAKGSLTHGKPK